MLLAGRPGHNFMLETEQLATSMLSCKGETALKRSRNEYRQHFGIALCNQSWLPLALDLPCVSTAHIFHITAAALVSYEKTMYQLLRQWRS